MKSFFQFLESTAVQQATRMGLTSDGHGGWYDKKGEFVAKTEKGSLKFFNKRQRIGQDPPSTEKEKSLSGMQPAGAQQSAQEPVAKLPEAPPEVEKTKGTLTVAFGRFNPPTTGHEKLLNQVAKSSDEDDYIIVPSRSQDAKKNPLDADSKVGVMRQMFPKHSEKIVNDPANRTIFDVLKKAHNDGYAGVRVVGGADRQKEFDKLVNTYNGKLYKFDKVEVVSAGDRDPDADDVTGMSASKMRAYATDGDFQSFVKGLPPALKTMQKREIFNNVRKSMNIKESLLWEIAPKLDPDTLREEYRSGNILNLGDMVENINTGLHGEIIRRGTNYVICVCENGIMFKSWLKDLQEYTEVKMDSMMRDKIHPNTLVGTKGFLKYLQMMTPGYDKGIKVKNQYK